MFFRNQEFFLVVMELFLGMELNLVFKFNFYDELVGKKDNQYEIEDW